MNNDVFIEKILEKGGQAGNKVLIEFSNLTIRQLNWRPSLESWSIAQCLEHLVISHSAYFPVLEKITAGEYKMNFWERYSPFSAKCGQLLKDRVQEQVKKKMKAPKKIYPQSSEIDQGIIERYHNSLERFLDLISKCKQVDVDRTIITSPILRVVTYSLRDAFIFSVQHEHRHINQAAAVKRHESFQPTDI